MINFEGVPKPFAYLHAFAVTPELHRRGIASKIVQSSRRKAREKMGNEGVVLAFIQDTNKGSLRCFKSFPQQLKSRLIVLAIQKMKKPPAPMKGIVVYPMENRYLEDVVAGLNTFYGDYNFYKNLTGGSDS
jgi:hypothetical protein